MSQGDFSPGDPILFIDGRDRQYLVLAPGLGEKIKLRDESLSHEQIAVLHNGELFISPMVRRYLVMKPTLQEVVMNMPRQAQVIYPKDLALMLGWGDVAPGMNVIEVGCGHGAFTMTLLRALGAEGNLVSFDLRQDHLNRTRKNIATYIGREFLANWTPLEGDPSSGDGFQEQTADRLFTDVPEPWTMLESAVEALSPGGIWVAYVPTVMQMSRLIEEFNAHPLFSMPEAFETLQRFWHVRPPSVRPVHKMKAHTGFIIRSRRRWKKAEA